MVRSLLFFFDPQSHGGCHCSFSCHGRDFTNNKQATVAAAGQFPSGNTRHILRADLTPF